MKFAKELERDAVPEWRIKYLNYKAGKKYVNAVERAVNRSPKATGHLTLPHRDRRPVVPYSDPGPAPKATPDRDHGASAPRTQPTPMARHAYEDEALSIDGNDLQYGSFVPTPPLYSPSPLQENLDRTRHFALPAPAIKAPYSPDLTRPTRIMQRGISSLPLQRRASAVADAGRQTEAPPSLASLPRRLTAEPMVKTSPSNLRRFLSHAPSQVKRTLSRLELNMSNFDIVREREREFHDFMKSELRKVESFYKMKEDQAEQRLSVLRQQLHEMRDRRLEEMSAAKNRDVGDEGNACTDAKTSKDSMNGWVRPIKAKFFPPGPNSEALRNMPTTPYLPASASAGDATRDYGRRRQKGDVPYRIAKRKLRLALQEFYRGLELLKSYALLNRTAFRKLNKKFDKAAHARPPLRFMNEHVNKSCFVNSEKVDEYIGAVEDLYARYFERGNHKLAAGKLRSLTSKSTGESGSSFLNGFLIGTALVFNVEGVIYGSQLLMDNDIDTRRQTSYLLQIYAGYFLILFMFAMFCIDCFIWSRNKINYPFIFEFDQRNLLDWRQLAEFPSFFFLLLGIFMWMNFSRYGADWLYTYYPVFLIGITIAIVFFPGRTLKYKSRKWFAYAHWRLLLAGLYPVEFRDFFLGDMYCSLTYAMANIELFFCLYTSRWNEPTQCNSSHSRLLGFLMTLPPIWRLLQCLRRYHDTRNIFPHLANGGKYALTIVSTVMLSLYRINNTPSTLAMYIVFSFVNGVYVSVWDLCMDFSLLQSGARYWGLREVLAFKSRWPYYFIMVVDPLLRFAWILYIIFTHDTQHSNVVSFLVSFVEILRRGMWALFRVENEHCANVLQYKASRDVPLPYQIEPLMDRPSSDTSPFMTGEEEGSQQLRRQEVAQLGGSSTAVASSLGSLRRRPDASSHRSFSKMLAEAHKQDFVKRRQPGVQEAEGEEQMGEQSDSEDDEEEQEEVASLLEAGEAEGPRRRTADVSHSQR